MGYRVVRLTGDYTAREKAANAAGCACVWQQHLNSIGSPSAKYALVEIAAPYTDRERACAKTIADNYARLLGGGLGYTDGVNELADGARGESIIDGNREAYISEPLFASNPAQAAWVAVRANQTLLAIEAVNGLKAHYPGGSVIGLSISHIGKTSLPLDRGAIVVGTGLMEADVCTNIIDDMETLLTGSGGQEMLKLVPDFPSLGFIGLHRLRKGVDYVLAVTSAQLAAADAAGYEYDGVVDLAPGGTVPLHQYRNGDFHLYQDTHPGGTWKDEGVLVHVHPVGRGATIYRLAFGAGHIYSLSSTEGAPSWKLDGPAFGLGTLAPATAPAADPALAAKAGRYDVIAGIMSEPL